MIYQGTIKFLFEETEQFQGKLFHIISVHFETFLHVLNEEKVWFYLPLSLLQRTLGRGIIQHNKATYISVRSVI